MDKSLLMDKGLILKTGKGISKEIAVALFLIDIYGPNVVLETAR